MWEPELSQNPDHLVPAALGRRTVHRLVELLTRAVTRPKKWEQVTLVDYNKSIWTYINALLVKHIMFRTVINFQSKINTSN